MKRFLFSLLFLTSGVYAQDLIPYRKGDKWGFATEDKKIVVKPKYDDVWFFKGNLARVMLKGKYGFVDKSGKEVIPPKYDKIKIYGLFDTSYYYISYGGFSCIEARVKSYDEYAESYKGIFRVSSGGRVGILDTAGREIVQVKYEDIEVVSGEKILIKFKINGKWGLMDLSGREILPPKYDYICYDKGKVILAGLIKEEGEWKIIAFDTLGNEITYNESEEREEPKGENEEFSIVERAGKKGVVDKRGKQIIPIAYDEVKYNQKLKVFFLKKRGKWGLGDSTGKIIIFPKYKYITPFCENLIAVKDEKGIGLIDKEGNKITPTEYNFIGIIYVGCKDYGDRCEISAISYQAYKSSVISDMIENIAIVKGSEFSDYEYYKCKEMNGFIIGKENEVKLGFINRKGKEVVPPEFSRIIPIGDFLIVKKNGKYGMFDINGNLIIPVEYDWISLEDIKYFRRMLRVRLDYDVGVVDIEGRIVLPPKYDDIKGFIGDDKFIVQVGAYIGVVDKNGNELVPAVYEDLQWYGNKFSLVNKDLKWGIFDMEKKKEVVPIKYNNIAKLTDEFAFVKLGDKWGIVELSSGKEILSPRYEKIDVYDEEKGLVWVKKGGKGFYIKVFQNGKVIEYYDR